MVDSPIENITVIGAGNVASQLCKQLYLKGYEIDSIVNSGSNVSAKFLDDINSIHIDQRTARSRTIVATWKAKTTHLALCSLG